MARNAAMALRDGTMYDAEVALHIAHQAHVDAWITATSDRLHEAILEHTRTVRALDHLK